MASASHLGGPSRVKMAMILLVQAPQGSSRFMLACWLNDPREYLTSPGIPPDSPFGGMPQPECVRLAAIKRAA